MSIIQRRRRNSTRAIALIVGIAVLAIGAPLSVPAEARVAAAPRAAGADTSQQQVPEANETRARQEAAKLVAAMPSGLARIVWALSDSGAPATGTLRITG